MSHRLIVLCGVAIVAGTSAFAVRQLASGAVTQPAPPVSASAFPIEPAGVAPVDGDGLIPNPSTPTGVPIAAPSSCGVTFASGSGATSASVNSWIATNEKLAGGTNAVDCNSFANLSTSSTTVNGNFALPSSNFLTLADWQAGNKHGWDADSQVGGFSPACPAQSIP